MEAKQYKVAGYGLAWFGVILIVVGVFVSNTATKWLMLVGIAAFLLGALFRRKAEKEDG